MSQGGAGLGLDRVLLLAVFVMSGNTLMNISTKLRHAFSLLGTKLNDA